MWGVSAMAIRELSGQHELEQSSIDLGGGRTDTGLWKNIYRRVRVGDNLCEREVIYNLHNIHGQGGGQKNNLDIRGRVM